MSKIINTFEKKIKMKKIILLISLALTFSCSNDDDLDTKNNNISDGQYFFEIEFAGTTHRIQGTTSEMFTNGQNSCSAYLQQGIQAISFRLEDITANDYISGQPLWIVLGISNPQLGSNPRGTLVFQTRTPYIQDVEESYNVQLALGGIFVENSPGDLIEVYTNNLDNIISNITITDLGTPPSNSNNYTDPNYTYSPFGDNIVGSYEGVLYFNDKTDDNISGGDSGRNLVVPLPIKISFSVPRGN